MKQEQFDSKMMEQMKKLLREWDVATKDDVQALEERSSIYATLAGTLLCMIVRRLMVMEAREV